ncbi:sensor histidine kinase [Rubritalea spongiae]|uniref:histidine kinase n=1 Tax=Rubritalea spongiae TaxID=430797 RepID=A0ABW5DXP2_9BACT
MQGLLFIIACLLSSSLYVTTDQRELEKMSIHGLEQRLVEIDSELKELASYTLRADTGAVGYRSGHHKNQHSLVTLHIDLEKEALIDEVVLVPCLWRESEVGLLAEGFPLAFSIYAGTEEGETLVASRSTDDMLLPRIAPLAVHFPSIKASWIRIEATILSERINGGAYMLQLSEVMVFSGRNNVALGQNVRASETKSAFLSPKLLTDGFTPYLMDAAQGERSQTRWINVRKQKLPLFLTLDLGAAQVVDQINFHAADTALSVPMINFGDVGVPRHVRVIGAMLPDFSDGFQLCEYEQLSVASSGPIIIRRFEAKECRFLRIEIVDHLPIISEDRKNPVVAFSEIEVMADGVNVAQGRLVGLSRGLFANKEIRQKITDGRNYYGNILPLRDWMNQLAKRHDLEKERPLVIAELNTRYARQKDQLHVAQWIAIVLIVCSVIIGGIYRKVHQRRITQIKERFAADLHDELGANLHTIGLLSDLALDCQNDSDELSCYLKRIRAVSDRSGRAARSMVDMQESTNLFKGLKIDMQRAADRIVADQFEHNLSIEGELNVADLKPQTRIDLYLFYKECLINACRHSSATRVQTKLIAEPNEVILSFVDNGRGIPASIIGGIPPSLKRRAKLLKGKLIVESSMDKGTYITLRIRTRKTWIGSFCSPKPPYP